MAVSPTLDAQPAVRGDSAVAAEEAGALYERYYDRVYGYCLYQLGNREEAEDAAQTTFMWAFRGLRRGVVPRAEASWLFTIAQNSCRARHRTRGRRREREVLRDPQLLADLTAAPAARSEELMGLEDALARMPELQRRAILMREWRGLSYREIAKELQLSGAAVETLIFRARRSLAELLAGHPAPKRARRFAFDFGSVGAAVKALFGTGTAAKVAAGLAAAVVATAVAGSTEQARGEREAPPTVVAPSLPHPDTDAPKPARAVPKSKDLPKASKPKSDPSTLGGPVARTLATVPEVAESLPVEPTVIRSVDETLGTVTGALPPAVSELLP